MVGLVGCETLDGFVSYFAEDVSRQLGLQIYFFSPQGKSGMWSAECRVYNNKKNHVIERPNPSASQKIEGLEDQMRCSSIDKESPRTDYNQIRTRTSKSR